METDGRIGCHFGLCGLVELPLCFFFLDDLVVVLGCVGWLMMALSILFRGLGSRFDFFGLVELPLCFSF